MSGIRIATATRSKRGEGWDLTVPSPPESWGEQQQAMVRLKSVSTGAVAEVMASIVRTPKCKTVTIRIPRGTAGLEPNDIVAVSVPDIDLESWFASDESVPLARAAR